MATNSDRTIQTNSNLLSLLGIGEHFRRLADPEGILSAGRVTEFQHSRMERGSCTWRLMLSFPHGECLCVAGSMTRQALTTESYYFPDKKAKGSPVPLVPGQTVVRALGDLSSLPSRLKWCLSSFHDTEPAAPADIRETGRLFALEQDALFWNVEGGKKEDGLRHRFTSFNIRFHYQDEDIPVKAVFTAVAPLREGKVLLTMEVDVYGLGAKKAALYRNVGMGRFFEADCVVRKDGAFRSSLTAAFDIDARLPIFYTEERNLRKERDKTPKEKVPQRDIYVERKDDRTTRKNTVKETVRHEQRELNERAARNNNHPKLK